jgi:hypothetical protein
MMELRMLTEVPILMAAYAVRAIQAKINPVAVFGSKGDVFGATEPNDGADFAGTPAKQTDI